MGVAVSQPVDHCCSLASPLPQAVPANLERDMQAESSPSPLWSSLAISVLFQLAHVAEQKYKLVCARIIKLD